LNWQEHRAREQKWFVSGFDRVLSQKYRAGEHTASFCNMLMAFATALVTRNEGQMSLHAGQNSRKRIQKAFPNERCFAAFLLRCEHCYQDRNCFRTAVPEFNSISVERLNHHVENGIIQVNCSVGGCGLRLVSQQLA
jgi:hypothetical protein